VKAQKNQITLTPSALLFVKGEWPKDATLVSVETADGKRAEANKKSLHTLANVDGVVAITYGRMTGKGKAATFAKLAQQPNMDALFAPAQVAPVAPAPATDAATPEGEKVTKNVAKKNPAPVKEKKVKPAKQPRGDSEVFLQVVGLMEIMFRGGVKQDVLDALKAAGHEGRPAITKARRVVWWYKVAAAAAKAVK
jgi:hypothetical protein